jgi:alkyl hydroperoxide reductase subunit F
MYDVIIIGAGPAGMTAAIYTARKKLKTLVLTKDIGGQMVWSSDVENYPGFLATSGADLTLKFQEHVQKFAEDIEVKTGAEVASIEKNIVSFQVHTKDAGSFYGKSIIIASGKEPRHLGVPGEDKFLGKGLAICATCDAPFYKNKDVAVVGGGNSAMDALLALSKSARRIYNINIGPELVGDEVLKSKIVHLPQISFYTSTKTLEIMGTDKVNGLKIQRSGKEPEVLGVQGIFVEIGYIPSCHFDALTNKNEKGEIIVDNNLQTSVPGIFSAGDINDAWGEQIVIAAGEGAKAAMAVANYLHRLK